MYALGGKLLNGIKSKRGGECFSIDSGVRGISRSLGFSVYVCRTRLLTHGLMFLLVRSHRNGTHIFTYLGDNFGVV